jgi:glycosyltransferase involved in cell wall biosynthesis
VARLLQAAQVVVAPSVPSRDGRREGIPVVLMEAMASAVPVVSSRLSGIPELVEDGQDGLLTPPGDTAALADVLEQLYRDPGLRYRLGQAGREKVKREFDLYRNAAALARHFGREISS